MNGLRVAQIIAFALMVTAILAALQVVHLLVAVGVMGLAAFWFAFVPQDWG